MSELLVIAVIGTRRCALRAHDVQSVIEVGQISPIPRTAPHILGLAALRSQALTVIDCRIALGLPLDGLPTDDRAVVVKVAGHSFALVVDAIEDVEEALTQPERISGGFGVEWSRVGEGLVETGGGPVLLLDVAQLVAGHAPTSRPAQAA